MADIQKDIVAMDAFWISQSARLNGPRGPLLHVFSFHRTKAPSLCYCFFRYSQRKIEWQKQNKTMDKTRMGKLFFFVKKKETNKKRQTLLSTINYYLLRRYLFMLSSPTIVEAVVNIFILSFCVLKLSCKGSCYITV